MFTARYALSPYIKQTRLVFKGSISSTFRSVSSALNNQAVTRQTFHEILFEYFSEVCRGISSFH